MSRRSPCGLNLNHRYEFLVHSIMKLSQLLWVVDPFTASISIVNLNSFADQLLPQCRLRIVGSPSNFSELCFHNLVFCKSCESSISLRIRSQQSIWFSLRINTFHNADCRLRVSHFNLQNYRSAIYLLELLSAVNLLVAYISAVNLIFFAD